MLKWIVFVGSDGVVFVKSEDCSSTCFVKSHWSSFNLLVLKLFQHLEVERDGQIKMG